MTRVVITQPNLLPWCGYYYQLLLADKVIFLDDVQYTRRDWRNRNQFEVGGCRKWVSLPVVAESRSTQIRNVKVHEPHRSVRNFEDTLKNAYKMYPHYVDAEFIHNVLLKHATTDILFLHALLKNLNMEVLARIAVNKKIDIYSSYEILKGEKRSSKTEHLIDILDRIEGCDIEYLSAPASRAYLDESLFAERGIKVKFFEYPLKLEEISDGGGSGNMSVYDSICRFGIVEVRTKLSQLIAEENEKA